jgi:hypothetical protein
MQQEFEYRAQWRQGAFEWWNEHEGLHESIAAVTLTLRDVYGGNLLPTTLGKWLDSWLVAESLTGILVVEESRGDARLHAHGIVAGAADAVDHAITQWRNQRGFTVRKQMTDKMGWLMYCFKAVTSESVIVWRRGGQRGESILTPVDNWSASVSKPALQGMRRSEESLRKSMPEGVSEEDVQEAGAVPPGSVQGGTQVPPVADTPPWV